MPVRKGSSTGTLRVGNSPVSKAYRGATEVFSAGGTPVPVQILWSGGLQDTSITLNARLTGAFTDARFLVSTSPSLTSPIYSTVVDGATTGDKHFTRTITGLTPNTEYHYGVETNGIVDAANRKGRFKTAPTAGQPANFTTQFASCSYPTTASRTRYAETDALMFTHLGDLSYGDQTSTDIAVWREQYRPLLSSTWYPSIVSDWTWSDHDYGLAGPAIANQAYRELAPHYPLPNAGAIYHAYTIGRVRCIVLDHWSYRDWDASLSLRTTFGAAQLDWFEAECLAAKADPGIAMIIVHAGEPISTSPEPNDWPRIKTFLTNNGLNNFIGYIHGDLHMLAMDSGPVNGFPVFCAAPTQSTPADKGGTWDIGKVFASDGQYGEMQVTDNGDTLTVRWAGRNGTSEVLTHSFSAIRPSFTSNPAITGTATTGQTLTVNYAHAGTGPRTVTRQWYQLTSAGAGGAGNLYSATGTPVGTDIDTYAIPSDAAGKYIGVVVTVTNFSGSRTYSAPTTAAVAAGAPPTQMSGGTVTESGGYRIHTFTSNGTLTPVTAGTVEYLVVAGGGGGGMTSSSTTGGGGGGAGGVLTGSVLVNSAQTITIGAGGVGAAGNVPAGSGGNTVFGSFTAIGGGRGGSSATTPTAPTVGGSGGGGQNNNVGADGTAGQGSKGGDGRMATGSTGGGGGGGGASAVGGASPASAGGAGVTIFGVAVGGGGGGTASTPSAGGLGGGGQGGTAPTAGAANTGGGGGGNRTSGGAGAAGGSGVVIIRYLL